jgi:glutamate racemase
LRNTSSARALRNIQQKPRSRFPDRRVLGVIRPSVEEMSRYTKTGTVAVWGTEGTVRSESYRLELEKLAPAEPRAAGLSDAGPLVEAGELEGPPIDYFIDKYWSETARQAHRIDTSSWPAPITSARRGHPSASSANGPTAVPVRIRRAQSEGLPDRHPEHEAKLSRGETCRFLTTDRSDVFDRLAAVFLGYEVASERVDLDSEESRNAVRPLAADRANWARVIILQSYLFWPLFQRITAWRIPTRFW